MYKPKILLSAGPKREYYIDAVERCDGVAVCEYCPEVDTSYDGLIICGGSDIHPKYYSEDVTGAVSIDIARDEAELALIEAFIKAKKPILGICRGHQLLNVYFGGTLCQHLPTAHIHTEESGGDAVHGVYAVAGSLLDDFYGEGFFVNSHHHQAIDILGEGLHVTARSADDGVIEAFEHDKHPIFGIQWHPERMCFSAFRSDTVLGSPLFEFFVCLCRTMKAARRS